jgi:MFS family permease
MVRFSTRPLMKREFHIPSETDFPYLHVGILFMASLTSALPLTALYPYVALMVVKFGAAPDIDHAGYYSGFIVSAFMIGRLLTSYYWGSAADRIGRKPIVTISCFAITILSLLFGMSVNLWMAILTRFCLGLLNPLNSVVKTMTSEICSRKHQPLAMSIGVGAWSVGLVIGPTVSGLDSRPTIFLPFIGVLAEPARQFPGSVLNNGLFRMFPFLLPNIFTAFLSLTTFFLVYFYLPETYKIIPSVEMEAMEAQVSPTQTPWPKLLKKYFLNVLQSFRLSGAWNLLKRKRVFYPCFAYCIVSLTSIVFDEVLILYAMSTPSSGGLGFSHLRVGYSTSVTGFPMMATTFILTPYLNQLYPSSSCFLYAQLLGAFFSFVVIFLPFIYHHSSGALITIFILIATGGKCCAVVAFSSVFLLINDSVDSDERGALNGLAVTLAGVSKALGPMLGSILFAWSISNGLPFPFNYAFVFLLNTIMGIAGFFLPLGSHDDPMDVEELRLVRPSNDSSNDEAQEFGRDGIQLVKQPQESNRNLDEDDDDEDIKGEEDEEKDDRELLNGITKSDGSRSEQFSLRTESRYR